MNNYKNDEFKDRYCENKQSSNTINLIIEVILSSVLILFTFLFFLVLSSLIKNYIIPSFISIFAYVFLKSILFIHFNKKNNNILLTNFLSVGLYNFLCVLLLMLLIIVTNNEAFGWLVFALMGNVILSPIIFFINIIVDLIVSKVKFKNVDSENK